MSRILFLNQFFPPDPAPTGVLFREIADLLAAKGHEVDFVSAGESYRGSQGKGGRMRRELASLFRMLMNGVRRRKADVVVSGTSPPCLAFVAALIATAHGARHVHWAMDVYPEIAVALEEVKQGGMASFIELLVGWSYRQAARVVALDEDMAARLARHGVTAKVIRPWVFAPMLAAFETARTQHCSDAWTWIYSGNLGRAHEWETILQAQAILEKRGVDVRLLFQGGGPSWPVAQARARELGLARCEWKPYVEERELPSSLLDCEVCVVTQRPCVQGLLWPSKLGLVMALPRRILWIGPTDGAIARELQKLPGTGIFAPGESEQVAQWVTQERREGAANLTRIDARAHREQALHQFAEIVLS